MRQFILENQSVKNGLVTLEGKDFRYLRQVLRVKIGDMVNLRLPEGSLQNSTVVKIDDKAKKISLQFCANSSAEKSVTRGVQSSEIEGKLPNIEYWLFQFIPRPQKLEQIVRQATECGVAKIVPVIGEYSEKSSIYALEGNEKDRLERIIKEARQQSGSPVDTCILPPQTLEEAIESWNNSFCENEDCPASGCVDTDCRAGDSENGGRANTTCQASEKLAFVLSERDDCSDNLKKILAENPNAKKIAIAVGSEGGISPEEVALLQEKGLFYPIHFTVNILRCETAALYGIAAVQSAIN